MNVEGEVEDFLDKIEKIAPMYAKAKAETYLNECFVPPDKI